jgi:hypothetical protein
MKRAQPDPRAIPDPEGLNLDSMTAPALWNLHDAIRIHPRLTARELHTTVSAARTLANYAANKAVAMKLRAAGSISEAKKYEAICERLYSELPSSLKW